MPLHCTTNGIEKRGSPAPGASKGEGDQRCRELICSFHILGALQRQAIWAKMAPPAPVKRSSAWCAHWPGRAEHAANSSLIDWESSKRNAQACTRVVAEGELRSRVCSAANATMLLPEWNEAPSRLNCAWNAANPGLGTDACAAAACTAPASPRHAHAMLRTSTSLCSLSYAHSAKRAGIRTFC